MHPKISVVQPVLVGNGFIVDHATATVGAMEPMMVARMLDAWRWVMAAR